MNKRGKPRSASVGDESGDSISQTPAVSQETKSRRREAAWIRKGKDTSRLPGVTGLLLQE